MPRCQRRLADVNTAVLATYLAGLPFAFRVVDPPELRVELRAFGRRLVRDHG